MSQVLDIIGGLLPGEETTTTTTTAPCGGLLGEICGDFTKWNFNKSI